VKALTVRQPWASLIVHGVKTIETRSRRVTPAMFGRIGIIAGKAEEDLWVADGRRWLLRPELHRLGWTTYDRTLPGFGGRNGYRRRPGVRLPGGSRLPLGRLIGTVELYDCVPIVSPYDGPPAGWGTDERVVEVNHYDDGTNSLDWWEHGDGEHPDGDWSDQLPYGDFTPGRWAWLLRDPQPCDPVPMKGAQGWLEIEK